VYLGGWREVPIFDLNALAPGQQLAGPAIVESESTTILLRAGDLAVLTRLGWLDLTITSAAA
jgi:N-methylhydantoinase A